MAIRSKTGPSSETVNFQDTEICIAEYDLCIKNNLQIIRKQTLEGV